MCSSSYSHDECQDRRGARYREPDTSLRPSAIESLTHLHNVSIIKRIYVHIVKEFMASRCLFQSIN